MKGYNEAIKDRHVHQFIAERVIDSCRILHDCAGEKEMTFCVENMIAQKDRNKPPDPDNPLPDKDNSE